jgi:hypothetical protein
MSGLPRALTPWAEQLSIFPEELVLSLGPWLPRLSALLGSLRTARDAEDGEPDGFDGLVRRGDYERLLLSDWLYADEAPDEFLRRATMGELSFLRLARREPHASRRCLAVFDAGPHQLGSPRIVHLALLIVLARRAACAGAELGWGVFQEPGIIHHQVTPATVLALLGARSSQSVTPTKVMVWAAQVEAEEPDDLWTIGGEDLAQKLIGFGGARVCVTDVLEPNRAAVSVEVHQPRRSQRSLVLELPPSRAGIRLLRDPFEVRRAAPTSTDAAVARGTNLVVSRTGRRVFLRLSNGGVVAFHIPHSTAAQPGRLRYFHPWVHGEYALAVELNGRRPMVLTKRASGFALHGAMKGNAVGELEADQAFVPPGPHDPLRSILLTIPHPSDGSPFFAFQDARGHVFGVERQQDALRMLPVISRPVTAVSRETGYFVVPPEVGLPGSVSNGRHIVENLQYDFEGDGDFAAVFGHGTGPDRHPWLGLLAVRDRVGRWKIHSDVREDLEIPDPSGKVIGLVTDSKRNHAPALIVLRGDLRTISLVGDEWQRDLVSAQAEIAAVDFSEYPGVLAWLEEDGTLVAFAFRAGDRVVQTHVEAFA